MFEDRDTRLSIQSRNPAFWVIAVEVKQVVFDKSSVGIGILFRVLATE